MTKPVPALPSPAVQAEVVDRATESAEREVDRLLQKAERLADQAEKPEAGANVLVGIARLRSTNAGLDKRHAQKVTVEKTQSVDDWVNGLGGK